MLSGDGSENVRLIRKKKKQLCTCSTLFVVHFFPVLLHDYNVKLPETSELHEFMEDWYRMCCW